MILYKEMINRKRKVQKYYYITTHWDLFAVHSTYFGSLYFIYKECGSYPGQKGTTERQLRDASKTIHICNHLPRGIFLSNHRFVLKNKERICNKKWGERSILKGGQMILFSLPPTTAVLDNALKFSITTDLRNHVA